MSGQRFEFAPLERLVDPDGRGPGYVASVLGLSAHSVHLLRSKGLSVDQADRFAVRFGLHPGEVWDGWWDEDAVGALFVNLWAELKEDAA